MPVVALLRPAVLEACDGRRVLLGAQHVLEVVDAEVQEEIILLAGEEVQLAVELRAERCPVAARVLGEIVAVLAHVRDDVLVDRAGLLVEQRRRVAVRACRTVRCLPDVELIVGAAARAEHRLELRKLPHRPQHLAFSGALHRPLGAGPRGGRHAEHVAVAVDVAQLVAAEVDRVGIEDPGAADQLRVVELHRQGFPAAGRGAFDDARIRLWDQAERLFQVRHQLARDRVAPWTIVRRVHGVRLVVVRARDDRADGDDARKVIALPGLVELVAGLQVGVARARERSFGVRRRVRVEEERRAVAEHVNAGKARLRVICEAARQQYARAEIDGLAPELAQDLAFYPHGPEPLRIRLFDVRRDGFGELDGHDELLRSVQRQLLHFAVEIAGKARCNQRRRRQRDPQIVSVRASHVRVADQQGLHVIVASGQFAQVVQRIRCRAGVDDHCGTGARTFDVHAEGSRASQQVEQQPRLRLRLLRNRDDQPTGDRPAFEGVGEGHLEARCVCCRRDRTKQGRKNPEQRGCQPVRSTHVDEDGSALAIRYREAWRNAGVRCS